MIMNSYNVQARLRFNGTSNDSIRNSDFGPLYVVGCYSFSAHNIGENKQNET